MVARRRRSRAKAEALVQEFEASGVTRQAFCADRGLSVAALDKYRKRHGHRRVGSAGRLVAVEGMTDVSVGKIGRALSVELGNGRRIEVGSGFDAATLKRLLTGGPAGSARSECSHGAAAQADHREESGLGPDLRHTEMASFRALELGFNLAQQTNQGLSAAYD